jgi:hypothetical protein
MAAAPAMSMLPARITRVIPPGSSSVAISMVVDLLVSSQLNAPAGGEMAAGFQRMPRPYLA